MGNLNEYFYMLEPVSTNNCYVLCGLINFTDLLVDQADQSHLTNGIVDQKSQTILTTAASAGKTHFSPIGPLHLTAEECNEILMKRALAASHPITGNDGHTTSASKA